MIRLIKIAAYALFAIFLPLWLYVMTEENIKKETKQKTEDKQGINISITSKHIDTLLSIYSRSGKTKHDTFFSPNLEIDKNINRLTEISIANAQALQTLRRKEEKISFDKITVDINQSKKDTSNSFKTPVYIFNDTFRFPSIKVPSRNLDNIILSNMLRSTIYILYPNQSVKDTAQFNSFFFSNDIKYNDILRNKLLSFDTIQIPSGMDYVLKAKNYSQNSSTNIFYLTGFYAIKQDKFYPKKYFRIPVIIEQTFSK